MQNKSDPVAWSREMTDLFNWQTTVKKAQKTEEKLINKSSQTAV